MENRTHGETSMIRIRINGTETPFNLSGIQRVTDLIELIKAVIDPAHMISRIFFNDRELQDHEWSGTITQMGEGVFEIDTEFPEVYVGSRLRDAGSIVNTCYMQFRDSRKLFQDSRMTDGNKALVEAVNTLKEFFNWYCTMVSILPEDKRGGLDLTEQMNSLAEVCKRICQQQLYQSWWALGESIKMDLEPKLDQLEDTVRRAVDAARLA